MNENFIQINGISKHFGNVKAVDDVSFSIREGEFFSLLGPSGCGKTTCGKFSGQCYLFTDLKKIVF